MSQKKVIVTGGGIVSGSRADYIAKTKLSQLEGKERQLFSLIESGLTRHEANKILSPNGKPEDGELVELIFSLEGNDFANLGTELEERKAAMEDIVREGLDRVWKELGVKNVNYAAGIHLNTDNPHAHIIFSKYAFDIESGALKTVPKIPRQWFWRNKDENSKLASLFEGAVAKKTIAIAPESVYTKFSDEEVFFPAYEVIEERINKTLNRLSEVNGISPQWVEQLTDNRSLFVSRQGSLTFIRRDVNGNATGYIYETGYQPEDEKGFFYIGNPKTASRFIITENPKEALAALELSGHRDLSEVCIVASDKKKAPIALEKYLQERSAEKKIRVIWALGVDRQGKQEQEFYQDFQASLLETKNDVAPALEFYSWTPKQGYGRNWSNQIQFRNLPGELNGIVKRVFVSEEELDESISQEETAAYQLSIEKTFKDIVVEADKDVFVVYQKTLDGKGVEYGRYIAANMNGETAASTGEFTILSIKGEPVSKTNQLFTDELEVIQKIEENYSNKIASEFLEAEEIQATESAVLTSESENAEPARDVLENQPKRQLSYVDITDRLKAVPLEDVLGRLGLQLTYDPKRREYVYRDTGDIFKIKIKGDLWNDRFDDKRGGRNAINLVMHIEGKSFVDARQFMLDNFGTEYVPEPSKEKAVVRDTAEKSNKIFVMPERAENRMPQVFNYLTEQRGISESIVTEMIEKGFIFSNSFGSNVFVHKDENENVRGASWRSTAGTKRGDYEGSDKIDAWFYIGKPNTASKFIIVESPIEAMSYYQLHQDSLDLNNTAIISTATNSVPLSLVKLIERNAGEKAEIVVAYNNDKHGAEGVLYLLEKTGRFGLLKHRAHFENNRMETTAFSGSITVDIPRLGDWNDDLQAAHEAEQYEADHEHVAAEIESESRPENLLGSVDEIVKIEKLEVLYMEGWTKTSDGSPRAFPETFETIEAFDKYINLEAPILGSYKTDILLELSNGSSLETTVLIGDGDPLLPNSGYPRTLEGLIKLQIKKLEAEKSITTKTSDISDIETEIGGYKYILSEVQRLKTEEQDEFAREETPEFFAHDDAADFYEPELIRSVKLSVPLHLQEFGKAEILLGRENNNSRNFHVGYRLTINGKVIESLPNRKDQSYGQGKQSLSFGHSILREAISDQWKQFGEPRFTLAETTFNPSEEKFIAYLLHKSEISAREFYVRSFEPSFSIKPELSEGEIAMLRKWRELTKEDVFYKVENVFAGSAIDAKPKQNLMYKLISEGLIKIQQDGINTLVLGSQPLTAEALEQIGKKSFAATLTNSSDVLRQSLENSLRSYAAQLKNKRLREDEREFIGRQYEKVKAELNELTNEKTQDNVLQTEETNNVVRNEIELGINPAADYDLLLANPLKGALDLKAHKIYQAFHEAYLDDAKYVEGFGLAYRNRVVTMLSADDTGSITVNFKPLEGVGEGTYGQYQIHKLITSGVLTRYDFVRMINLSRTIIEIRKRLWDDSKLSEYQPRYSNDLIYKDSFGIRINSKFSKGDYVIFKNYVDGSVTFAKFQEVIGEGISFDAKEQMPFANVAEALSHLWKREEFFEQLNRQNAAEQEVQSAEPEVATAEPANPLPVMDAPAADQERKKEVWEMTKKDFADAVENGEMDFAVPGAEISMISELIRSGKKARDEGDIEKAIATDIQVNVLVKDFHRGAVVIAAGANKPVPEDVLAEYPQAAVNTANRAVALLPAQQQSGRVETRIAKILHAHNLGRSIAEAQEGFYVRLTNDPWMDLHITKDYGTNLIRFTHWYEQNGDAMHDGEMNFFISPSGHLKLNQVGVGLYGVPKYAYDRSFAEMFSKNLIEQGFEKAQLVQEHQEELKEAQEIEVVKVSTEGGEKIWLTKEYCDSRSPIGEGLSSPIAKGIITTEIDQTDFRGIHQAAREQIDTSLSSDSDESYELVYLELLEKAQDLQQKLNDGLSAGENINNWIVEVDSVEESLTLINPFISQKTPIFSIKENDSAWELTRTRDLYSPDKKLILLDFAEGQSINILTDYLKEVDGLPVFKEIHLEDKWKEPEHFGADGDVHINAKDRAEYARTVFTLAEDFFNNREGEYTPDDVNRYVIGHHIPSEGEFYLHFQRALEVIQSTYDERLETANLEEYKSNFVQISENEFRAEAINPELKKNIGELEISVFLKEFESALKDEESQKVIEIIGNNTTDQQKASDLFRENDVLRTTIERAKRNDYIRVKEESEDNQGDQLELTERGRVVFDYLSRGEITENWKIDEVLLSLAETANKIQTRLDATFAEKGFKNPWIAKADFDANVVEIGRRDSLTPTEIDGYPELAVWAIDEDLSTWNVGVGKVTPQTQEDPEYFEFEPVKMRFSFDGAVEHLMNDGLLPATNLSVNRIAPEGRYELALNTEPAGVKKGTILLANEVRELLHEGKSIGNNIAFNKMSEIHLGGSRAAGTFDARDAYDALELGVNLYLLDQGENFVKRDEQEVLRELRQLIKRLPTQTDRTDEQQLYQQFSTVPTESYVASVAAGIQTGDIVLEPSAGTATLAMWSKIAGNKTHVNEISDRRAGILRIIGFDSVNRQDAQFLNDTLDQSIKPTLILMNPPFSSTGGRTRNKTVYGAEHITDALLRLQTGGRLVAIVGEGMAFDKVTFTAWWSDVMSKYNVKANISVPGEEYAKYGTSFGNQLLIIDKTGPTPGKDMEEQLNNVVYGEFKNLESILTVAAEIGGQRQNAEVINAKEIVFNGEQVKDLIRIGEILEQRYEPTPGEREVLQRLSASLSGHSGLTVEEIQRRAIETYQNEKGIVLNNYEKARWEAIGIATGNRVEFLEQKGYRVVFGQAEGETRYDIAGVLGPATDEFINRGLTIETVKFNRFEIGENITRYFVKNNPHKIFLFGDNLKGVGYGGQAREMRNEMNAIGIPTIKEPTAASWSYFTDDELEKNREVIDKAFAKLAVYSSDTIIVLPKAGLATALSELEYRAPQTLVYLNEKLKGIGFRESQAIQIKTIKETAEIKTGDRYRSEAVLIMNQISEDFKNINWGEIVGLKVNESAERPEIIVSYKNKGEDKQIAVISRNEGGYIYHLSGAQSIVQGLSYETMIESLKEDINDARRPDYLQSIEERIRKSLGQTGEELTAEFKEQNRHDLETEVVIEDDPIRVKGHLDLYQNNNGSRLKIGEVYEGSDQYQYVVGEEEGEVYNVQDLSEEIISALPNEVQLTETENQTEGRIVEVSGLMQPQQAKFYEDSQDWEVKTINGQINSLTTDNAGGLTINLRGENGYLYSLKINTSALQETDFGKLRKGDDFTATAFVNSYIESKRINDADMEKTVPTNVVSLQWTEKDQIQAEAENNKTEIEESLTEEIEDERPLDKSEIFTPAPFKSWADESPQRAVNVEGIREFNTWQLRTEVMNSTNADEFLSKILERIAFLKETSRSSKSDLLEESLSRIIGADLRKPVSEIMPAVQKFYDEVEFDIRFEEMSPEWRDNFRTLTAQIIENGHSDISIAQNYQEDFNTARSLWIGRRLEDGSYKDLGILEFDNKGRFSYYQLKSDLSEMPAEAKRDTHFNEIENLSLSDVIARIKGESGMSVNADLPEQKNEKGENTRQEPAVKQKDGNTNSTNQTNTPGNSLGSNSGNNNRGGGVQFSLFDQPNHADELNARDELGNTDLPNDERQSGGRRSQNAGTKSGSAVSVTAPGIDGPNNGSSEAGNRSNNNGRAGTGQLNETAVEAVKETTPEDLQAIMGVGKNTEKRERLDDLGVVTYKPAKITKGVKHPADIVESASMAAVEPPDIKYTPKLDKSVIEEGKLSDLQLEAVVYAGQRHDHKLPNGMRSAMFIGDGTGVGKGRELAGITLDNWNQGRKRVLWLSINYDLVPSADRDLKDLGATNIPLASLDKHSVKADLNASVGDAVLFASYSTLIGKGKDEKTRFDQIVNWLGEDGVILFDEGHLAKNAVSFGMSEASQRGEAVVELQIGEKSNPNWRFVYSSATGATELRNMAYMQRLGLWGEGSGFPGGFIEFFNTIDKGGIGAMEMVARDMKASGMYMSRSLSFRGVDYRQVHHNLTPEQKETYNKASEAWSEVVKNFDISLNQTNANNKSKAMAFARLWSAQQMFYRQLMTAIKVPSVIRETERLLEEGSVWKNPKTGEEITVPAQIVVGVIGTGEARTKDQVAKAAQMGLGLDELDFSPKQILLNLVETAFPTKRFTEKLDPGSGKTIKVPVVDKNGKQVESQEALMMRDALIAELNEKLQLPDNPLDQIINHFGVNRVAEMTGRDKRIIVDPDTGERQYVKRAREGVAMHLASQDEMLAFQAGRKQIAIISQSASTGISLHAELKPLLSNYVRERRITEAEAQAVLTAWNERQDFDECKAMTDALGVEIYRRVHITQETSWSADIQMQTFGRSHRSNQLLAPEYVLMSTDLGGEKRFLATIAKRLGSLGALTKGDRGQAGGGDILQYDFENRYGLQAAVKIVGQLRDNSVELMTMLPLDPKTGEERSGMHMLYTMGIAKREGNVFKVSDDAMSNLEVSRFLNRVLMLDVDTQNAVFDSFTREMEQFILRDKELGLFDAGVQDIEGKNIRFAEEPKIVSTDASTGAHTYYYKIYADTETAPVSLEEIADRNQVIRISGVEITTDKNKGTFYQQTNSKNIIYVENAGVRANAATGDLEKYFRFARPSGWQTTLLTEKELVEKFTPVLIDQVKTFKDDVRMQVSDWWQNEFNTTPKTQVTNYHLITGAVLPVWQRLSSSNEAGSQMSLKTVRIETEEGERIVGVQIPSGQISRVLRDLGVQRSFKTPEEIFKAVLETKDTFDLVGGIRLRPTFLKRQPVIQIMNISVYQQNEFQNYGALKERVGYEINYFIPNDEEKGVEVLKKILAQYPAVESQTKDGVKRTEKKTIGKNSEEKNMNFPEKIKDVVDKLTGGDKLGNGLLASISNPNSQFAQQAAGLKNEPIENYWWMLKAEVNNKGQILLNPASYEFVRRTYEQTMGYEIPEFDGLFNDEAVTGKFFDKIENVEAQSGIWRESIASLRKTLQEGRNMREDGFLILLANEEAAAEEELHVSSHLGAYGKNLIERHARFEELKQHDAYIIAKPMLMEEYNTDSDALLVEELWAKTASGKGHLYHLLPEESAEYTKLWFKSFAEKNGNISKEQFKEISDESARIRDNAYREIYTERKQRELSEGREGRELREPVGAVSERTAGRGDFEEESEINEISSEIDDRFNEIRHNSAYNRQILNSAFENGGTVQGGMLFSVRRNDEPTASEKAFYDSQDESIEFLTNRLNDESYWEKRKFEIEQQTRTRYTLADDAVLSEISYQEVANDDYFGNLQEAADHELANEKYETKAELDFISSHNPTADRLEDEEAEEAERERIDNYYANQVSGYEAAEDRRNQEALEAGLNEIKKADFEKEFFDNVDETISNLKAQLEDESHWEKRKSEIEQATRARYRISDDAVLSEVSYEEVANDDYFENLQEAADHELANEKYEAKSYVEHLENYDPSAARLEDEETARAERERIDDYHHNEMLGFEAAENRRNQEVAESRKNNVKGDEIFEQFKSILTEAKLDPILNTDEAYVKFETPGRNPDRYEISVNNGEIRFVEMENRSETDKTPVESRGIYFAKDQEGNFNYAGSFDREQPETFLDPVKDELLGDSDVQYWKDEDLGANLIVTKIDAEEELAGEIREVNERNGAVHQARQLGNQLVMESQLNQAVYELDKFNKESSEAKFIVKVEGEAAAESREISLNDLERERSAIARAEVADLEKTGILKMTAEDENTTVEEISEKEYVRTIQKVEGLQSEWIAAVEKAISEQRNGLEGTVKQLTIRQEQAEARTAAVIAQTGEREETITPIVKSEILWNEQIKAAKRGDVETFTKLEKVHQETNKPRPNEVYAQLRGAQVLTEIRAAEADKAMLEWTKASGDERLYVKIEKNGEEFKINNSRLDARRKSKNELLAEHTQKMQEAGEQRDKARESVKGTLNHLINPFSPVQGTLSWITQPKETLKRHINPIDVIKNDPGVKIVRGIYKYLEHTLKAKELETAAKTAMENARLAKDEIPQMADKANQLNQAVKESIGNEEALRTELKKDPMTDENLLKTPECSLTDEEVKYIGRKATELGDAELVGKYHQVIEADPELAASVGETADKAIVNNFIEQTRLAAEANNSIESVEVASDGSIELEINPAYFSQAARHLETSEVTEDWQVRRAGENEFFRLDLEEAQEAQILASQTSSSSVSDYINEEWVQLGEEIGREIENPISKAEQKLIEKMTLDQSVNAQMNNQMAINRQSEVFYETMAQNAEIATQNGVGFKETAQNIEISNPSNQLNADEKKFWQDDRQQREKQIQEERTSGKSTEEIARENDELIKLQEYQEAQLLEEETIMIMG